MERMNKSFEEGLRTETGFKFYCLFKKKNLS